MINISLLTDEKQKSIRSRIIELTNEIEAFQNVGGDIYAERRELPYYERVRSIVRSLRKEFQTDEVSYEDVYALCEIKFDRDWNTFMTWIERLGDVADENGFVDSIRSDKGSNALYNDLSYYAEKYNTNNFDFLVLMTPFSMKEAMVSVGDYDEYLKAELHEVYGSGDADGIRHDESALYEKIRQSQKYTPGATGKDMFKKFNLTNERVSDERTIDIPKSDEEIITRLEELYPDHVVGRLIDDDKKLYYDVVRAGRNIGMNPKAWLEEHSFAYPSGITNTHPQTRTKINTEKRAEMLRSMKAEIMKEFDLEGADDIDIYHANLEAAKRVIEKVNQMYQKHEENKTSEGEKK